MPGTITQRFEFYNTVNVIEKDKNIYFHPVDDFTPGVELPLNYYWLFGKKAKRVVTPNDNKLVTNWYPDDRTLKVLGNVELYRDSRKGVNYMLLIRKDSTETYSTYKGYFVTDVKQSGMNTVVLSLEPDTFTNYFFWENTTMVNGVSLTESPLNEAFSRTNIERQHYDRYDYIRPSTGGTGYYVPKMNEIFCNNTEKFDYRMIRRIKKFPLYTENRFIKQFTGSEIDMIHTTDFFSDLSKELRTKILRCCISFLRVVTKENILSPILKSENAQTPFGDREQISGYFNKYQKVKNVSQGFQSFDIPFINIPDVFEKYSDYINEAKIKLKVIVGGYSEGRVYFIPKLDDIFFKINSGGLSDYIINMSINTYSGILKKIESISLSPLTYNITVNDTGDLESIIGNQVVDSSLPFGSMLKKYQISGIVDVGVSNMAVSTMVPNASYVGKGYTWDNALKIDGVNQLSPDYAFATSCIQLLDRGKTATEHIYRLYLPPVYDLYYGEFAPETGHLFTRTKPTILCFLLNDIDNYSVSINIDKTVYLSKEELSEPILDCYPYHFASVSYMGLVELTLEDIYFMSDTNRFIKSVNLKFISSVNDCIKLSLIPEYGYQDDIKTDYFNSGLSFNITSSFPINSSSYLSYYYQNQAQMKNQYAINNIDFASSMEQLPTKTIASIGAGGVTKGIYGAVAGGISSATNFITEPINWYHEQEKIKNRQSALLSDIGVKPDNVKNLGTDVYYDIYLSQNYLCENEYTIDEVSRRNIEEYLNRYGYEVNRYDTLDCMSRKSWNYVKLISFDFKESISLDDESKIRKIMTEGVTLVHIPEDYKSNVKNIERRLG